MGDFVFQRTNDMFNFFRPDDEYWEERWINVGYWAEKLQASSVRGRSKHEVFNSDLIMPQIIERLDEYCEDMDHEFDCYINSNKHGDIKYKSIESFTDAFKEEVNDHFKYEDLYDDSYAYVINDFKSYIIDDCSLFDEWYEWLNTSETDSNYLWCCYAIVWAIKQYDNSVLKGVTNGN